MRRSLLAASFLLAGNLCSAQATPPSTPTFPCRSPEARQFDFWLGDWDLTGRIRTQPDADEWQGTRSTNTIRSTMDGCVVLESFENLEAGQWTGMSVSVWNPRTREWQQTWVDSQGSYIPLRGEFRDGKMTLTTPPRSLPGGGTGMNRMVFHDITTDSLIWDWELSRDGGQTWEAMWSITYRRRK